MTTLTHEGAVAEIALNRDMLLVTAEKILRDKVASLSDASDYTIRSFFDADELAVFDSLAWDRRQLRREAARIQLVVRQQSIAGTTAEREIAKKAAEDAAAKLAAEGDGILAELAKWQTKLDTLKRDAADAAAVVEKQEQAIEHLREAAPAHVYEQFHRLCTQLVNDFAQRKAAATTDRERAEIEAERLAARADANTMLDLYAR